MVKLFVEGGGDSSRQHAQCREGFRKFLESIPNVKGQMPRIVACGSRQAAYKDFCHAIEGENCLLLVDSECAVSQEYENNATNSDFNPWGHLMRRDGWIKPEQANANHCHLMVECMEAWLIADKENLEKYYSKNFNANKLSKQANSEKVSKDTLFQSLNEATKNCQKGKYSKGGHSFSLLGTTNFTKISCVWAKRFFDAISQKS